MSEQYEPLHHKYRPQSFDSLVGQDCISETLKQAIRTKRIAPAYIFCGPRGTGKTSSARILARSLNCTKNIQETITPCGECELCKSIIQGSALDVIEIDAASNTGVDNIRELIEKSRFAPVIAKWKVYVIDECHMLSTAAFNALLKTLEEPPERVVFILATTDPQRVLPTILSRCQRFDFRRIPLRELSKHLKMISAKEGISIEDEAIEGIAKHSQGGLRDAESMLDQLSLLPSPIKLNTVLNLIGVIPDNELIGLVESIADSNPLETLKSCNNLLESGKEPIAILQGFASVLRDLIIKILAPEHENLCNLSNESLDKIDKLKQKLDIQVVLKWQSQLKGTEYQLRQSLQPRLWLEVLLLGLIDKPNNKGLQENIAKEDIKGFSDSSTENLIVTDTQKIFNKKESSPNSKIKKIDSNEENSNDLRQIWERILSSLTLPSTKMLLSQQAQLTKITQETAEISVASNWIGMIQSRSSLIEDAIKNTLGSPRKIILNKTIENKDSLGKQKIEKNIGEKSTKKVYDSEQNAYLKSEIRVDKIEKNIPNESSTPKETGSNEAEKLAEFFNGEIINLD